MTTRSHVIRQSDLLNQLVLDRNTMEALGRVEVLWMYPEMHRVLGFVCKSGFLGAQKAAFKLAQIDALGENGILTHAQPDATDAETVNKLESLLHHEIWSDAGNKIGKITDCLFNLETGAVSHYLFVSSGWFGITGEVYQLPPSQILSFGKKRVLVSETALESFPIYQEGLQQKLSKTSTLLKEEAVQEWRSLTRKAESVTEQAKGRFQHLTEQAKDKAQRLSQQAKEKAQVVNEQLKEKTQTFVEQAKETSQHLTEQIKERTQTLGKQVEDSIETLTVQAEEIFDAVAEEVPKPSPPINQPTQAKNSEALDDDDEPWI